MTLAEILEKHNMEDVNQKTNVTEDNIQALMDEDFSNLTRAKTIGFISILEREYGVTLQALREKATLYYDANAIDMNYATAVGLREEGEEASSISLKWMWLVVLGLLVYGAWYFMTHYDLKALKTWIPFGQSVEKKTDTTQVNETLITEETTSTVDEDIEDDDESNDNIEIEETTVEGE